jgi:hypothetical protein
MRLHAYQSVSLAGETGVHVLAVLRGCSQVTAASSSCGCTTVGHSSSG